MPPALPTPQPRAVYKVTAASDAHRALVLRDRAAVAAYTQLAWGQPLAAGWQPLELVAAPATAARPLADISALYFPGHLVLTAAALSALAAVMSGVEPLELRHQGQPLYLLNPLARVTRFREAGARAVRVPSGALLFLDAADFHEEDLPGEDRLCWLHDGQAARFLLCGAALVRQVREAQLTGLSFTWLGQARPGA